MYKPISDVHRRIRTSSAHSAGEPGERRGRWRRTLAGVVIATMAASGLAMVASPAVAAEGKDKKSDSVVEETVAEAPAPEAVTQPPVEEPVAEVPVEEAAAEPPVEEAVGEAPAEDVTAPPVDGPTAAQETSLQTEDGGAVGDVQLLLVPPGDDVVDKVEICHGTAAYKNPYIINEPAADGDASGHAGHTGPIFYPEIPKGTEWGDIIPPFYYDGPAGVEYFPGLNWTAEGQAIYANDCVLPQPPVVPTMSVEAMDCVVYIAPSLTVFLYGLQSNLDYRVTVSNQNGVVDVWTLPAGTDGDASYIWNDIPGGSYTVTFEQSIIAGVWEVVDTANFTVVDCPVLGVTAEATACSNGDDGTAVVKLTGLVPGEDYSWTLSGPNGTTEGTLDEVASATLDVPFGDLPPGDYVFDVSWPTDAEPVVSAQASFTVDPCPTTPVKPAALAASGAEGTGGLLAAALVLFGLGGAALAFRGRRPLGARDEQ